MHTMLIAFDGSTQSERALRYAAKLLKPRRVELVTVWEPLTKHQDDFPEFVLVSDPAFDPSRIDDPAWIEALTAANAGLALARSLNLEGAAHLKLQSGPTWAAIAAAAEQLVPDVIVTGTRAVTGIRSIWQTSTAEGLVSHSGLPVLVVPPHLPAES